MEIILDLDRHCIETETEKQYNRTLSRLLGSGSFDRSESRKLEILKFLLENLDFHMIRSFCKECLKERNNHACISENNGHLDISVNGTSIYKGKVEIDED